MAENATELIRRSLVRGVIGILLLAACLFVSAGGLDWPMAWAYLGVVVISLAGSMTFFIRTDPALVAERLRFDKDTKGWDKLLAPLVAVVVPLALSIVAGLDRRFGWSAPIPLPGQIVALTVTVAGTLMVYWSMAANTFFAATVRIQAERGHRVITGGPYRYVRHPGYVGAIVADLALPLALGSLWALIPGLLASGLLVLRTALEDATLKRELAGYEDYAARVRYRLLPGVW
ncbi:MAG: isoprenylcysteine carboxylmethyltransferase family protein [Minwuiales bacterium]|nr:isoprenylcysteine carboxylmethyltransferase family protein [Minwuiales bacterium]